MTILRGLPGSGKSHLACSIQGTIVSADTYPGLYVGQTINLALLDKAHGNAFREAIRVLDDDYPVIVDNTNLTQVEVAPYVLLAQAFRVACRVVTVCCPPELAFKRNVHGIPHDAFLRMQQRMAEFSHAPHWQFLEWLKFETYGEGIT